VSIDRAIRTEISRVERQDSSRRIVSRALNEHRRAMSSGRTMAVANSAFLRSIREGREEIAEEGERSLFDRAYDTVFDTVIEKFVRPTLDRLLSTLGLNRAPLVKRVVRQVLNETLTGIVRDFKDGKLSLEKIRDCNYIASNLALASVEAIPKVIIDTTLGGEKAETEGILRLAREAVANFFADTETVQKITDAYSDFICEIDFSQLMTQGAEEIQRAIGMGDDTGSEEARAPRRGRYMEMGASE
jgi:hypothetical protein